MDSINSSDYWNNKWKRYNVNLEKYKKYYFDKQRHKIFSEVLKAIKENLVEGMKINSFLDAGCGNGEFINSYIININNKDMLVDKPNISGFDHSIDGLTWARNVNQYILLERVDFENKQDVFKIFEQSGITYDVITCIEVIEHIKEAENLISNILHSLKDENSFAVFSVPKDSYFPAEHIRMFNSELSIIKLFGKLGRIIDIKTIKEKHKRKNSKGYYYNYIVVMKK